MQLPLRRIENTINCSRGQMKFTSIIPATIGDKSNKSLCDIFRNQIHLQFSMLAFLSYGNMSASMPSTLNMMTLVK
ncbi:hypothetical protein D3C80_2036640 [compost metagenome]